MALEWTDPFRLSDQLTSDEKMVRETARSYARDKLQSRIVQANRDGVCVGTTQGPKNENGTGIVQ